MQILEARRLRIWADTNLEHQSNSFPQSTLYYSVQPFTHYVLLIVGKV
jgi:hypothetical protein